MSSWKKNFFFNFLIFFSSKRKITQLQCDLQRVISRIFSRFGYGISSPCLGESDPHVGAYRTCTQKAQKYETSGTNFLNFCAFCVPHVCLVCVPHECAYLGVHMTKQFRPMRFQLSFPIFLTPHRCLCDFTAVFAKTAGLGGK